MARESYLPAFFVLFLTGLLHFIGAQYFLYWHFWWFDILLHFLGGVWVAATCFWLYYFSGLVKVQVISPRYFFLVPFVGALIVGVAWEVFEYLTGLTFVIPGIDYKVDTICDIGMDVIGGMVVYLYYRLTKWKLFVR